MINQFLDKKWQKTHLKIIKERAGNRYTPKLNVSLPISEIFDGISRTENFYNEIRAHYGKLNREFSHVSSQYANKEIQKNYNILQNEISNLTKILEGIKKYNTYEIPWKKCNRFAKKANSIAWALSDKLRNEKEKIEQQKLDLDVENEKKDSSKNERIGTDIRYLYELKKELRYFMENSLNTKTKLSNSPFLFLKGVAGTGKTHLLCDVIENRIKAEKTMPAVLVFGELFMSGRNPFQQIIQQLDLKLSKKKLLRSLNIAGGKSACRSLLIIDALNETRQQNFWKQNLNIIINELKKYPNIALIVSIRSGFEDDVLTKSQIKQFIQEEHQGFQFREWEAVHKFFTEFSIPLPEIPLLLPEFREPLFLLLFCAAFGKKNKDLSNKTEKQLKKIKPIKGHIGATHIFEAFVKQAADRIAASFKLPPGKNQRGEYVIWDTVIERIAEEMVNLGEDKISELKVIEIINNAYPSIDYDRFIKELDRNLLLVKIPKYSPEKNRYEGFDFRFPFQKFSDHLIGRYIFKKYETEFGKTNKNIGTAKKFFSKRRRLGKLLSNTWNRGIIEALSVQCPEQLRGIEFIDVAPYLRKERNLMRMTEEAFIESIIWRSPMAISQDRVENISKYIDNKLPETVINEDYFPNIASQVLNALLSVAPIKEHPLNADFLHKHLMKPSMELRDSWWSTFLHYQFGEKEAIDRLIEWGWSEQNRAHLNDESIRLCAVALCWFLTTSNRILRDKATKALVALLTNRLNVVLDILKQFKNVNDLYLSERIYAVAYGCAMRSNKDKNELKILSKWVYKEVFKQGNPPKHILLRDYARGIIEVALHEKLELKINRKKIEPPFHSPWPKKIPTEKTLKSKYYPEEFFQKKTEERGFLNIWSSIMYNYTSFPGDFGKYVINHSVENWSGRRLKGKELNRKIIFEKFKKRLNNKQKKLLEKATNPFFGISFANIMTSIKYISPSEEDANKAEIKQHEKTQMKKIKQTFDNFTNSLSKKEKKIFDHEIKPFLKHGNINDPLEHFDTSLAQRWIFNRVVELGWKPKLHGKFDKRLSQYLDRSEPKTERIGKKYQWIALHELLARISDNFEFKTNQWSSEGGKYEGPWQLTIRDIDPSCTLKEFPNDKSENIPDLSLNECKNHYNAWNKRISDSSWLKRSQDLPNPKKIIELIDDQNKSWLTLEGFVEWQDETPPEHEKYHLPTRTLWYMLKSYLVRNKDKKKVFDWSKKQHFMGRWMPESHGFHEVYLGEYPWAKAFLFHYIPYFHRNRWTKGGNNKKIPSKILVTDDEYVSSGSSIDCSTNEPIRVKLPAKFIVDKMNLKQNYVDGRFFNDKGDLVVFDTSVFDIQMPKHVIIKKDELLNFLKRNELTLIWTLLGEKNMMGGGGIGQPLGYLEIDGAYALDKKKKITGGKRTRYKKTK